MKFQSKLFKQNSCHFNNTENEFKLSLPMFKLLILELKLPIPVLGGNMIEARNQRGDKESLSLSLIRLPQSEAKKLCVMSKWDDYYGI
jgi:hypothetical protein